MKGKVCIEMASNSIFRKVVSNENSYTQLLCNLMIRFQGFGNSVLEHLLPPGYASHINDTEIQTQHRLREGGCPDILIRSSGVLALVEVKLDPQRGLTNRQAQSDEAEDRTYLDFLSKEKDRKTCLTFLIPKRWHDRRGLDSEFKNFEKQSKYSNVEKRIVCWEEVLDIARSSVQKTGEPLLGEFLLQLMEEFMPITFSSEEVAALFSSDFVGRFETIRKLEILVDEIDEKVKKNKYARLPTRRPDEFGIYFKDSECEAEIWFGIWPEFWKHQAAPLSFGIKSGNKSLVEAFRALCGGPAESYGGYTIRSFGPEFMKTFDPVEKIWEQLEPVLKRVLGLGALGKVG
jgi:hypothetical protein